MQKEFKPFDEAVMLECLSMRQTGQITFENLAESYNAIFQMAGLMLAPIKPELFIPMKDDEPLKEPLPVILGNDEMPQEKIDWNEANEKVIFEGFQLIDHGSHHSIQIPNLEGESIVVYTRTQHADHWMPHFGFKKIGDLANKNLMFKM
jgi:hypothetical protein